MHEELIAMFFIQYKCICMRLLGLVLCLLSSACAQAGPVSQATEPVAIPITSVAPTLLPTQTRTPEIEPTATLAPTILPTNTPLPIPTSIALADATGRTISLSAPAHRIISLAPSNTELLFAVGAGDQLVGRDSFSDFPQAASQVPDIGYGFTGLNLEVVLTYQPDLVLASALTPLEEIKAMEAAGLIVFTIPNPIDFESLFTNLVNTGKLTGHEPEAVVAVDALRARYTALVEKTATVTERPLVFYELDSTEPNAPWTTGPGTFIDLVIRLSGGENVAKDLRGEWIQVSVEELLVRDPDIILLGDATYGGVTPEMVKARTGWEGIKAVKEDRIYPFDDNLVSRPGPRLVDGLEAMARLLHPELFE
jgi:iron complex transport system substrate-binding protein